MASTDPAHSDASTAALIPLGSHAAAAPIELKRPVTLIGSRKDVVRLHLHSSTVSKAHCAIVLNAWGCYVHDLASRTGTLVNGTPVTDQDLADGDVVQVGRFQFRYRAPAKPRPKPEPLPAADLTVSTLDGPLAVHKRVIVVGRRVGSDVQFDDSRVSNIHALIVEQDGRRLVRDLTSRTGTWLDDKPVHQEPLADGAVLKVGGATLSIRDAATPAARAPDAPLTLAEAAPAVAAGLDALRPADLDVADPLDPALAEMDLGKLAPDAFEPDPLDPAEPDDIVPADDLAALRRNWTAPVRPLDEAPRPAEPADTQPADTKSVSVEPPAAEPPTFAAPEPSRPQPIELEAIELEPIELTPVESEAVAPQPLRPETPDIVADRLPDDADLVIADDTPAAEADDEAEVDVAELAEVAETPAAVPLDADAAPMAASDPDPLILAEPAADAEPAVDVPIADEAETAALPAAEARSDLQSDDLDAPELDVAELDLADSELELDADAPTADASPVAGEVGVVPDPDAPALPAEADEPLTVAELPPRLSVTEPTPADLTLVADPAIEAVEAAEATPPLDLSDIALEPDPVVAESAIAESEPAPRDPDAPAAPPEEEIAVAVSDTAPADEIAGHIVSDTPSDAVAPAVASDADVPWTTPAAAEVVFDAELDRLATTAEAEAEIADVPGDVIADESESADIATDELADAPTPAEAVAETVADSASVPTAIDASADLIDEPSLDDLTLDRRLDADAAAGSVAPALAAPLAEMPAVEPHAAVDAPHAPAADPLGAAAFVGPPDAPIEPDLIRLGDERDEDDASDATALAVDLGLVLEDDHPDLSGLSEPVARAEAPAPTAPVEIDLTTARLADPPRGDSIDLSHLGADPDAPAFNGLAATAGPSVHDASRDDIGHGGDADAFFDPDDIELIEPDTVGPAATAAPVSEQRPDGAAPGPAADADDEIGAPQGGSLADLMPSGPPLLGGSFMSIPQMAPPTPADLGGRRRPLRVGFGQDRAGRAAPFAAERTIADALGGVDADATLDEFIASSPGGGMGTSVDAFSGTPVAPAPGTAGAATEPAFEIDAEPADAAGSLLAPAERFRPRGVIRPDLPAARPVDDVLEVSASSVIPFDARAASADTADAHLTRSARHKRRVRRIITCLVAMIALIGGAAAGVYYFLPIKSTVDALISFDGLDRLGTDEAKLFRVRQDAALVSESVRQKAVQSLRQPIPAGFLADGKRIYDTLDRDPKIRWPGEQPTVMRLRVRSVDKENDIARVRALGETFVKSADTDRSQIDALREKIRVDEGQIIQRRMQIGDLSDQLQALQQASSNRANLKDPSALNAEFLAAEPALTAIKSKRQELEATIVRLKLPAPAVATPAVDPVAADEELAKLTRQLNDLQQPAARPEATAAGAEARKKLDDSIAQFQKDLAAAGRLRDNPQLTAYVEAANGMFTQFREMTESFIRRQENNRTRLSELKSTLSDKMQARTQELLETDTELKKIKDGLAILERQHNAAIGQGSPEDIKNAQKSELEMRLLRVKIGEREDKFRTDTGYSEAITGIQSVIDASEKESRADRKNIDERLTALQSDFLKNAPAVEKLPAEQKALAEGFEAKLAAMNDARRAYDAAADQAQADAKAAEAAASEKIAALRLQVAARRQDVLAAVRAKQAEDDEATRKTRLAAAQTDLATVRQQEQAAQHRVADAAAAIEAAEKQRRVIAQSDTDRQAKQLARDAAERDLRSVQGQIATRQGQLARLIVPDRKVEMQFFDDVDRRPLLAGVAGAAIALLLLVPIVFDLLALSRESHPHPVAPSTPAEAAGGFEPVLADPPSRKALPEPASV